VENYKKYLVLAKDKTDLKAFAKIQETIFQLENAKTDAFNITGPTSHLYLSTSKKLFELYFDDEDYEEALDIAKEIFEIYNTSTDIKEKSISIVNLGLAYLKNGNISEANKIAETYTFDENNPLYPQYCLFRATLAQVYKNKDDQLHYLHQAYNKAIEKNFEKEVITNILLAIALYYEKIGDEKQAYKAYLEIFNKAGEMSPSFTDEERYSFLIRLSKLALKNNNNSFAADLLSKSKLSMEKKLEAKHPLTKIVNKELENIIDI